MFRSVSLGMVQEQAEIAVICVGRMLSNWFR